MTRNFAIACHLLLAFGVVFGAAEDEEYWPQWRGPLATGVAPGAEPPIEWSETRNVRWKVAIVGQGSASPGRNPSWDRARRRGRVGRHRSRADGGSGRRGQGG